MPVASTRSMDDNAVSYIGILNVADEARARKMLEQMTAGSGITIESYHARVNETFPKSFEAQQGRKMVFFSSSDDNIFRLGGQEIIALQDAGIQSGTFRDNRNTVQNAREDGMGSSRAPKRDPKL